ncbi:MAG: GIY-YIG nuclease family protein [Oscillospiraceae bacterium]|nr:GIY-YIG nuclease family protein [Oscillospiraceae bacterium]
MTDRPYWVYILRCADGSLYTGITTDVARRVGQHNAGTGAKYTRSHRPVEPVYRELCPDKPAALRRERAIKALTHGEKLALTKTGPPPEKEKGCTHEKA